MTHLNYFRELQSICWKILGSIGDEAEIQAGELYEEFLKKDYLFDEKHTPFEGETYLSGGVALSPKGAQDCIKEHIRTVRFIKGINKALSEKLQQKDIIELVYLGCGPYATLILPLLTVLPLHRICFTVVDINEESVRNAERLVYDLELFGFYNINFVKEDAIRYKHSKEIDLVVCESMHSGLIRETQTAITRNIANQMSKDGIMIPSEIKVNWAFSYKGLKDFTILGNLLTLSLKRIGTFKYSPVHYDITVIDEVVGKELYFLTEVEIFGGFALAIDESTITRPLPQGKIQTKKIVMTYEFNEIPKWKIRYVPCIS